MHRRHADHVLADQTLKDAVPYVSVIHAVPMSGQSDLILPGALQAFVISPIYARTNGYLSKWYKDIGSKVTKGELLAEIETPEIDQQLAQARADLVTAQANLGLSNTTATRYQDLIKTDSVSKQEVDNAVGDLAAKKSTVHPLRPTSGGSKTSNRSSASMRPSPASSRSAIRYRHADQRGQRRHELIVYPGAN